LERSHHSQSNEDPEPKQNTKDLNHDFKDYSPGYSDNQFQPNEFVHIQNQEPNADGQNQIHQIQKQESVPPFEMADLGYQPPGH
jgi:hypothetical protein